MISSDVVGVLGVGIELSSIYIEAFGKRVGDHKLQALRESPLKLALYSVVITPKLILVSLNRAVDKRKGLAGRLRVGPHVLGKGRIITNGSPQTPAYRANISEL